MFFFGHRKLVLVILNFLKLNSPKNRFLLKTVMSVVVFHTTLPLLEKYCKNITCILNRNCFALSVKYSFYGYVWVEQKNCTNWPKFCIHTFRSCGREEACSFPHSPLGCRFQSCLPSMRNIGSCPCLRHLHSFYVFGLPKVPKYKCYLTAMFQYSLAPCSKFSSSSF